jgi:hypothetical protein
MKLLRKLWNDEAGFIISAELVLVATIVVIAMVVGLVCIRNQVVQELIDVGQAIANVSQTYAYGGIVTPASHPWAYVSGASYIDMLDYCQQSASQVHGGTSGGITFLGLPAGASLVGEN